MRILILGGAGQVGSLLCRELPALNPGFEITATGRAIRPATLRPEINWLTFNPFTNTWDLPGKYDVVINCIGIIKESRDISFEKAHIGLINNLINERFNLGNPRIIQISVLGADKTSPSAFFRTKAIADELLLKEGDTVIIRPSIICTHKTRLVVKIKMLKNISRIFLGLLPFPGFILKSRIQPILGSELAEVCARLCMSHDSGIILAAGKSVFSMAELLKIARIKNIIPMPDFMAIPMMRLCTLVAPNILSKEESILLSTPNIADLRQMESIIGHPAKGTESFWESELA